MKKLNVIYNGWGERFQLGTLADDSSQLLFEYTTQAIERGLQLSPLKLPLATKSYGDFPDYQLRLPGLVSDALPDGWGMLLMDRLFRKLSRDNISPLDRLAFIGDKTMGALSFEPAASDSMSPADIDLLVLAQEVRQVQEVESEALLRELILLGGSPHGARPKVLVNFDRASNKMTNSEQGAGIPMLVKFPAQNEHKEVCAIEAIYGRIARACEIKVPGTEYFDLSEQDSAFGIERFDRSEGLRVPMHTAAGAAHVNFRIPQLDYVSLLRLTQYMTRDAREVRHAFERCVFNVVFNNRDDHSKNCSFLLGKDGRWQFSPAYDLTYCEGPNGEHQMDICGEARTPARRNLLELASRTGIAKGTAAGIIDRIAGTASKFSEFVGELPVRQQTVKTMDKIVQANAARLI